MIELGDLVKDKITGISGIVTCKSEWLTGCKRFAVQPRELKDGKRQEESWFDEVLLDVVEKQVLIFTQKQQSFVKKAPAGPMNDPRQSIGK